MGWVLCGAALKVGRNQGMSSGGHAEPVGENFLGGASGKAAAHTEENKTAWEKKRLRCGEAVVGKPSLGKIILRAATGVARLSRQKLLCTEMKRDACRLRSTLGGV